MVFHLKGGDRIAGEILSESTNSVTISTSWAKEVVLPLDQIAARELPTAIAATNAPPVIVHKVPATTNPVVVVQSAKLREEKKPAASEPSKLWRADAKLGMDMIQGEKDRRIYYGQLALKYTRPFESEPTRVFRNTLEYRADYARTDGVESANRMYGSDKVDLDIGRRLFVYNFAGAGYDEVRKIDLQYEVGPGLGYHLFRLPSFTANVEGGLSYQCQDRQDSDRIEALYARVGEDLTWKVDSRITFSQRAALLTRVDAPDQMQLRLEANLAFGIVKNVTFNLTAIELYDTRPVPGVTPSEFQLRSAIGLAF